MRRIYVCPTNMCATMRMGIEKETQDVSMLSEHADASKSFVATCTWQKYEDGKQRLNPHVQVLIPKKFPAFCTEIVKITFTALNNLNFIRTFAAPLASFPTPLPIPTSNILEVQSSRTKRSQRFHAHRILQVLYPSDQVNSSSNANTATITTKDSQKLSSPPFIFAESVLDQWLWKLVTNASLQSITALSSEPTRVNIQANFSMI